jgi:NAD(P)-dependent dehydrogenase (short-subunit alcohol dehydrogenase family)
VHAVAPGLIETDMLGQLPPDLKERALARVPLGRCTYPTGHVCFVDGGLAM